MVVVPGAHLLNAALRPNAGPTNYRCELSGPPSSSQFCIISVFFCISSSSSLVGMGRCQYQHCETHAVFNLEGSKSAAFCKRQSTIGMVDVVHKLCLNDACTKQPSFGVAGSKTSVYCKQHAKEGLVNVFNKRCLHESCVKFPTFNVRGSKTAVYCKQHAHGGMVDVYTKRCLHDCLLYTSPSPRDQRGSRMPSSA